MNKITYLIMLVFLISCRQENTTNPVGDTVNLPNFTCVLADNLKMNISQNTTKSVRILINGKNESSSMGQYLRVSGDTLYSNFTGLLVNANGNVGSVILDIAIPNLRSARTYATGQIIFTTPFTVTDLTVENKNGTGKIIGGDFSGDKLTVIANALDSVKVKVSNISNLNLFINHLSPLIVTGSAINTTVNCSSISSYNGFELYSKNLTVTNLSTGKLQVRASDKLSATIKGIGSIYYKGSPSITLSRTSTGNLINAN